MFFRNTFSRAAVHHNKQFNIYGPADILSLTRLVQYSDKLINNNTDSGKNNLPTHVIIHNTLRFPIKMSVGEISLKKKKKTD